MKISKILNWEMGHALSPPYVGKCNRAHGHHWEVEFIYEGDLDSKGMVLDFAEFRKMKTWIDDHLDHRFLVQHNHLLLEPYIEGEGEYSREIEELGLVPVSFNPTSENLAEFLHDVACEIMGLEWQKLSVTIYETCTSSATFDGAKDMKGKNDD